MFYFRTCFCKIVGFLYSALSETKSAYSVACSIQNQANMTQMQDFGF